MKRPALKNKFVLCVVVLLALSMSCSSAFAWGGHGHYYYRGGGWHSSGWFWGSFATGMALGAIVASLPPQYETVRVSDVSYYYYDGVYLRPCPSGYVVVQAPAPAPVPVVVAAPPAPAPVAAAPVIQQVEAVSSDTVTINIPNFSGGYTPVAVTKYRTGYKGPQGEYYEGHPTVEQLKVLYGK